MARRGFGWVGTIGWGEHVPPEEQRPSSAVLDGIRWSYLAKWMHALGIQREERELLLHPEDWAPIVDGVNPLGDEDPVVYIANAHGDSREAYVTGSDNLFTVEEHLYWAMYNRPPMKFSFLVHSEAMNEHGTVEGTWSYTLRKGWDTGTVVVGVKAPMTQWQWFNWQLRWATTFFNYVNLGYTFWRAFNDANFAHPDFKDYVEFDGDKDMTRADI